MKKTALSGVMVTLALIFSFIETLIPLPMAVPGLKLGLANIVVLFSIYKIGYKEALLINIVRIVLSGLLFGNMMAIMYALSGAVFSFMIMFVLKKLTDYHIITISIFGAVFHIIGQLIVAGFVVGFGPVLFYIAPLFATALVSGTVIGIICNILVARISIDMF